MEDIQDANLSLNMIEHPVQDNEENLLKRKPKMIGILEGMVLTLILL